VGSLQQQQQQQQQQQHVGDFSEECIEALVANKALHTYQQLQRLGFQRWQAASALQCFGLQLQLGKGGGVCCPCAEGREGSTH